MQDFVRWSSAFHHVLVFTIKKRSVLFISKVEYILQIETPCVKIYIFLPAKAPFGFAIKMYSVRYLYRIIAPSSWKTRNQKSANALPIFTQKNVQTLLVIQWKPVLYYHMLVIYDVQRTTKIDGMGPFTPPPLPLAALKIR